MAVHAGGGGGWGWGVGIADAPPKFSNKFLSQSFLKFLVTKLRNWKIFQMQLVRHKCSIPGNIGIISGNVFLNTVNANWLWSSPLHIAPAEKILAMVIKSIINFFRGWVGSKLGLPCMGMGRTQATVLSSATYFPKRAILEIFDTKYFGNSNLSILLFTGYQCLQFETSSTIGQQILPDLWLL